MITEKQQEFISDFTRKELLSECCGARVYSPSGDWYYCTDCQEYCNAIRDDIRSY